MLVKTLEHFIRYRCFLVIAVTFLFCLTEGTPLSHGETLVFPKLLQSRSENGGKVIKITDDLTLNLEKSSVVEKEFLLRTYQGHVMQHTYLDGEVLEEDLYHDPRSFASVMVSEENGLQVEGVLGPELRIKPMSGQERTMEGDVPHVLYEYKDDKSPFQGKGVPVTERSANISERQQANQIPAAVYPELIIVVDSTFRAQFTSNKTLLKYLIITMNSVNVRYLTVSNPTVQLKFRALEILTAAEETFLQRVGNMVVALQSLNQWRDYVNRNPDKYNIYDAVYLVTGLDMAQYGYYGWDVGLMGYAFIGGACGIHKVGYGEDTVGTFRGVRILAHEVGHLLGCPHDGSSSGYYSSVNCPWNDGFIMSYKEESSKSMKFSHCCNDMITRLVWSQKGACLRVKITKRKIRGKYFIRELPGDVLSRDKVCQLAFPRVSGTRFMADDRGKENCHARCFMPASVYGYNTSLPTFLPDNARCNENGGTRCLNGDCVVNRTRHSLYNPK
uniref:Putative tick metalloprotease 1 n=1 Tax=Amblyomma cajennense TaxID=34607 RepID=A0A023FPM4_AMBCJ